MMRKIGSHFHFNTEFMNWMKGNIGKTMEDAIAEWKRIYERKKDKNHRTTIASQFEYNAYIRAFLADNKDKTMKDAIWHWKLKRNQRGDNVYTKINNMQPMKPLEDSIAATIDAYKFRKLNKNDVADVECGIGIG
jgi:hypothetical protein